MYMIKAMKPIVWATTLAMLGLAGCSAAPAAAPSPTSPAPPAGMAAKEEPKAVTVPADPVTLKFFVHAVRLTDNEFQKLMIEPLKKTHPNITIEKLTGKLEDLVVSGNVPDIILSDNDWFSVLNSLDIPQDLTDLTKQLNIDLGKFIPESIQASQQLTEDGKLYAIPFTMNMGALFYNKDMFDKFGVAYPTDNMTWNQVLDISRKLTRQADGIQYIGWEPGFPDAVASPYGQPFVDPKTNKAIVDTDVYRKVLELFKQVYSQPGFLSEAPKFKYTPKDFTVDQRVGMMTEWSIKMMGDLNDSVAAGTSFNWDMVTIPNFEDKAGKGRHMLASMMVVSKTSPYKLQAMQVIKTVTSPEAQTIQAKNGRVPVLTDPTIIQQYGKDLPWLATKNTAALFKYKASPIPKPNLYDKEVQPIIRAVSKAISVDNKDINTALREAQDAADKKLEQLLKK
jgi:multiple sugar transport system substrate-binding protein